MFLVIIFGEWWVKLKYWLSNVMLICTLYHNNTLENNDMYNKLIHFHSLEIYSYNHVKKKHVIKNYTPALGMLFWHLLHLHILGFESRCFGGFFQANFVLTMESTWTCLCVRDLWMASSPATHTKAFSRVVLYYC